MERNNFLDCVRAVAVLLVVFRHDFLLLGGTIGVSVFFCLSGFLIATILIEIDPSPENLAKFVFRRLMRIWPMMVFSLLVSGVLLAALRPDRLLEFVQLLPRLLTYVNSPAMMTFGMSVGSLWTLQIEFWFYITMAVAVLAAGRAAIPWVAVIGFSASWLAKLELLPLPVFSWQMTLNNFDELAVGVLVACAIQSQSRFVSVVFSNRALCLWTPLGVVLALSTVGFQPKSSLVYYLFMSTTAYLTAVVILHQSVRPLQGDFEPFAALGRISYSLYLIHVAIFEFISYRIFPPAMQFIFMAGLAILISAATYRWIEKPFIRWSKRVAPFGDYKPAALAPAQI
jgi:peptidoglycan/LPS O-acetylase OafA/YrhL